MPLSADILSFLDWLDQNGFPFDLEYLKNWFDTEVLPPEDKVEMFREIKMRQRAASVVVEGKKGFVTDPRRLEELERLVRELSAISGANLIEESFTRSNLEEVPKMIRRLGDLKTLPVATMPGTRVVASLHQATTCFLYGLPVAAAALCRTVLQLALEEVAGKRWVKLLKQAGDDVLFKLIRWFEMQGHLPSELVRAAHEIRRQGNDAVHDGVCEEELAKELIVKTGRVLSHLYSSTEGRVH